MIPILFSENSTTFTSNGLGPLADAISCQVKEERNGIYELRMEYPITGVHYEDIKETRIILARPFDGGTPQPFIIYKISRPTNGVVTVDAEHISYRLSTMVTMPFTATNAAEALTDGLADHIVGDNPFSFSTDIATIKNYAVDLPRAARGVLGGEDGSILQAYGGEWEFDGFDCILHSSRGSDHGVTIRYGKNITDIKADVDMTSVYTGIVPYWTDGTETVTLPEKAVMSSHASDYPFSIVKPVDLSGNFEEKPTEAQLRNAATSYVNANEGWKLSHNITVSFVALWETEEYKNIAMIERVKLCDTVKVIYEPLGVNFTTKVIATDYDVLLERYNSITLGDRSYQLGSVVQQEIKASETRTTSRMEKSIDRATKLIQGGLGGHVVFNTNADGEPEEILIMDTDSVDTATNVIRMNLAGIGFSTDGYDGPFNTAWTIDGHFNASYIDTGTLDASQINVTNLSASSINTGTLNAALVSVTNLNASNITTGSFHATGALGSFDLDANAGSLTWSMVNSSMGSDGVFRSIKDGKEARIESGVIAFKVNGEDVTYFRPTTWHNTQVRGAAVVAAQNGEFIAFGKLNDSGDLIETSMLVNYGLNPSGREEGVQVYTNFHVGGAITGALYASASYLGFFGGSTRSYKRSVSNATTGSGATADNCAETINSLLSALRAYNLIS